MTQKEITRRLAEKYIKIWGRYERTTAYSEEEEKKLEAQIDLLDDIFEEFFDIKDLYVSDRQLMSEGKKVG